LDNDRLMYRDTYVRNIKTVAAEGAQCAYLDDGGVCVIDYYGDKNVYRLSGVGDIALDGDGGVVCLKKPYFEGVENLCAVSDEEYPEVSAVAVSVCGYQYAVLLHDGAVRSNIPWSHKAMAEKVPLTAISVSENLVLGITRDHRVFSSDDGIIGFENARKAVMFGNSVAVLLLNGNVYIGKSNHCVASDVSDIEACKNGLYMLQDDAICMIDSNGHKRVVAEEAASEFAVSESKLIYRKKNGGIEFCDL